MLKMAPFIYECYSMNVCCSCKLCSAHNLRPNQFLSSCKRHSKAALVGGPACQNFDGPINLGWHTMCCKVRLLVVCDVLDVPIDSSMQGICTPNKTLQPCLRSFILICSAGGEQDATEGMFQRDTDHNGTQALRDLMSILGEKHCSCHCS